MRGLPIVMALLLLGIPTPGEATAGETSGDRQSAQEETVERTASRVVSLTLEDCVYRAYTNNVAILLGREAAASAATFFGETQGAFDPTFFAEASRGQTVRPSGAQLIGGLTYVNDYKEDTFVLQSGFRGLMLTGATYQVDMALTRSYQYNAGGFTLNPQVFTNAGVQIRQPLLRDAWTTFNRAESLKAVLDSRREDLTLESTMSETVFNTVQAYWNLDYEIRNLETTLKSLALAEELLRINTRKMEEGIFTRMDVLEAGTDVATRKEQVLTARNGVTAAEDSLKKLIVPDADLDDWNMRIELLTEAVPGGRGGYDLDSLLGAALENRADYRALEATRRQREVDLVQADNQTLPQVDLTGDYRYSSLGRNTGTAFDDIWTRDYASYSVALSVEVPIGNRTAHYRQRRAAVELRKAIASLRSKKIDITFELREAVREIALQAEKVMAARGTRELALERYEGELKRLKAGRSISYLVREAERNHFLESVKENRARLDLQIALVRLENVKGVLLDQYGITVGRSLEDDWIYSGI